MTNLGQVCLFSNLITTPLQRCCGFWIGVVGTSQFFSGFKVAMYRWMIKISKGVGMSKSGRIKCQGGVLSFFQTMSNFVPIIPVSPDTILKERCLWQSLWLLCCFKYCDLDTGSILNINFLTYSVCEHSEYSGLTINFNAPFCFDRMDCLAFFGPGVGLGVSLSLLQRIFKTQFNYCI